MLDDVLVMAVTAPGNNPFNSRLDQKFECKLPHTYTGSTLVSAFHVCCFAFRFFSARPCLSLPLPPARAPTVSE